MPKATQFNSINSASSAVSHAGMPDASECGTVFTTEISPVFVPAVTSGSDVGIGSIVETGLPVGSSFDNGWDPGSVPSAGTSVAEGTSSTTPLSLTEGGDSRSACPDPPWDGSKPSVDFNVASADFSSTVVSLSAVLSSSAAKFGESVTAGVTADGSVCCAGTGVAPVAQSSSCPFQLGMPPSPIAVIGGTSSSKNAHRPTKYLFISSHPVNLSA